MSSSADRDPVLRVEAVAKSYPGPVEVQALAPSSLTIGHSSLTAILGRSGSGKSTLLTLLGLLEVPTSGRIILDGVDVGALTDRQRVSIRSRKVGFVFQSFNLVRELSAVANVELALRYAGTPRHERRERAFDALERVGLEHRATAACATLSGGEMQRVAIARACAKNPAVILADEPTGNLDEENEALVLGLLRAAADNGTAVVLVTHNVLLADDADETYTMTRSGLVLGATVGR